MAAASGLTSLRPCTRVLYRGLLMAARHTPAQRSDRQVLQASPLSVDQQQSLCSAMDKTCCKLMEGDMSV